MTDYFKLPDHRGGAIEPGTKHYRADGTEYTIADVPYRHVVREAIKEVQKMPEDRRTEAYKKVVDHISGIKKTPDWEREPVNPNAEPATAFSTSKAAEGSVKSNQQLLDDLALGLGLGDSQKGMAQAQIVYRDALGDDTRPASVLLGGDMGGKVSGGRLARDHTLADVPNHFCRDQIMDYINQMEDEDGKKNVARAAVFSDLNPGEKLAYSVAIAQKTEEMRQKEKEEENRLDEIMDTHKLKPTSILEAQNILEQETLLDSIPDDDLDLTQRGSHGHLDYDMEGVYKSVVKPEAERLPNEEFRRSFIIELDCDQLRACIKRFTRGGIWSVDQFRLALGGVPRPELTKFLNRKGRRDGAKMRMFALSWEFFKKREMMGLDMVKSSEDDIKQIEERGKKRQNPAAGDGNSTTGKKAKPVDLTADESDLEPNSA
ncbi:hypothetical protein D6D13_01870 [Aureobasidium pullulans]|uniref:DUF7726 domain-containing protein n=1 Tax=Aureobasidium pullulans TaxID=5580 RepID=A0A4S9D905_AURPU|nr:hypothetical protein D6D13_01870 [Aureobasidium pullulans]